MTSRKVTQNQSSDYKMKSFSSLPSCFLTPESAEKPLNVGRLTPTLDQSSSVFLSPPASLERKPVPNFAICTQNDPLKSELHYGDHELEDIKANRILVRSPLLSDVRINGAMMGTEKVDSISMLLEVSCDQICKTICGYLGDHDLCRFASVSRQWRTFVKHNSQLCDRRKTFLLQRKQYYLQKGKENLGSPLNLKDPPSITSLPRTPLETLNVEFPRQLPHRKTIQLFSSPSQTPELSQRTPSTGTYRPCPKCSSPSTIHVHDGYCQCQRCELKYCAKCLRDMSRHSERECKGLDEPHDKREKRTRQRRKAMDQVVGSKQTKDRMRRL